MENANSLIYETNRFMGEFGESMFIRKKKHQSSLSDSSSSIRLGGPSIAAFGFGCFCIGCIMPLTNWYADILGEE